MPASEKFNRLWRALAGMWYRQDEGLTTGRNSVATAMAQGARWDEMQAAFLAMDEPTPKQASRYGYAERRMKLGREDAERFKTTCVERGEW